MQESKEPQLLKQAAQLLAEPEPAAGEPAAQTELPAEEKKAAPESPLLKTFYLGSSSESHLPKTTAQESRSAAPWLHDTSWLQRYLPQAMQNPAAFPPQKSQRFSLREWAAQEIAGISFLRDWIFPLAKGEWIYDDGEWPAVDRAKCKQIAAALSQAPWIGDASVLAAIRGESLSRTETAAHSLSNPFYALSEWVFPFVKGSWLPRDIAEAADSPRAKENAKQKVRRFALRFVKGDWFDSLLPYLGVKTEALLQNRPEPMLASAGKTKPDRIVLPNAQIKKFAYRLFEQKKQAFLAARKIAMQNAIAAAPPPQEMALPPAPVSQETTPSPALIAAGIKPAETLAAVPEESTPELPPAQPKEEKLEPLAVLATIPERAKEEPPQANQNEARFVPPTQNEQTPLIVSSLFDWFKKKEPPPPLPEPASKRNPWPLPKRLEVRHTEGNQTCRGCQVGFGTNYTTIALLSAPEYKAGSFLPMIDLRLDRFDNVTYSSSVGLIARYIPESNAFCHMLGANLYYDFRQGSVGYFNQIGVGVEVLGRRWDFRANAYIPVGPRHQVHKCLYDDYIGPYYAIDIQNELVSYGFNGEVGYYFVRGKDFLLYGAAGPYYIAGRKYHDKTRGGMIRIKPMYRDFAAVEVMFSHDPLFNNIWQVNFSINLPLYELSKTNRPPCGLKNQQIYQPVQRFEVMPLSRCDCWETNY